MNKTVRSLRLLYRCYGQTLPADVLLDLFADGTPDVNTRRRTLRRYLADFRRAGVEATWSGRGAHATVHIPAHESNADLWAELEALRGAERQRAAPAADAGGQTALVERLLDENAALLRRLDAERQTNNVFRDLLRRQEKTRHKSGVGG